MGIKQERIAQEILQRLNEMFLYETSDPRLEGLSVTEVQIDREISHATIYVGTSEEMEEDVMKALDKANGFLRRTLAKSLKLRIMPELHFVWDPTLASAERINNVLDRLDIPETSIVDESAYIQDTPEWDEDEDEWDDNNNNGFDDFDFDDEDEESGNV